MSSGPVIVSSVELAAEITPSLIVEGLSNNDEWILTFVLQMLDEAGSSELEERLAERLQERKTS